MQYQWRVSFGSQSWKCNACNPQTAISKCLKAGRMTGAKVAKRYDQEIEVTARIIGPAVKAEDDEESAEHGN